ncbi:MAG TPA: DUF4832 domain-containing protein [Steroidobacter sp.]|uniref:DUF4832 domain-containing protein n=1 Tax=Steroidobacter sp. TaxID=1978227 RepID=UPI002ED79744
MKRSQIGTTLLLAACALSVVSALAVTARAAEVTYTADDTTIFANPERGFHHRVDILALSDSDIAAARSTNSISLLHSYLRLDAFRTSNIDQATLNALTAAFGRIRAGGAKIVFRTSYNFGPYPNSEPDASEAWIATHLNQLRPILQANADVIAYLEAGFIGAWGEWHTSTNGLDTNIDAKARVLKNIMAATASDEQVALRYPSDVRLMLARSDLTAAERDRIGNHQDCYGASDPDDWGTWARDPAYTVAQDKALIGQVGVNHFVGGETCNVSSPRADCATALAEMPGMHFTELNIDYEPGVIQNYRNQGCFDTMQRQLGYRLRLTAATYPTNVSSGGAMTLNIGLSNSGWASVINPRPVFAVLDGPGGRFDIPLSVDPRSWEAGQSPTINQTVTLPTMPNGTYRLALWLPDQATNLRNDPRYSIRLANTGTWDSASGLNVLATNVVVGTGGGDMNREAEDSANTLGGSAVVASCSSCSGGSKVGWIGGSGVGTLAFNGVNGGTGGSSTLTIGYSTAEIRGLQISVNGGAVQTLSLPSTGGWNIVGTTTATVNLSSGSNNTIRFTNASGPAPDLDRLAWTVPSSGGGDTTPPTTPPSLTSPSHTSSSVSLNWGASTDTGGSGLAGYDVYRGTTKVNVTPVTGTTYIDSGLAASTSYSYTVRARDGAGNLSNSSNTVTITTDADPTPASLVIDDYDGTPAWSASTTNDLGSWTGANGFANGGGAGVASTGALNLQYANSGWFGTDIYTDVTSKTYLVFRIKGNSGNEQSHFHVSIGGVDKRFDQFVLATGGAPVITTSYQDIRIPLVSNGISRTSPGQLALAFWFGASGTVSIDEIRFE